MSASVISVVIPTWDRCGVLSSTLRALNRQEGLSGGFEVVVVDDGSSDDTLEMLRTSDYSKFDLKTVALEHGGPARARNRGISEAAAERVLLLGDDMVPEPNCLGVHLSKDMGVAIQGMVEWDPEIEITDVMRFLAPEGPQFYFKGLSDGSMVPFTALVTANLSAPRSWFLDEPFDERFSDACMEDTELAYRWRRRGWRVVFSDGAACRHRHHYDSIEPFLERQLTAGRWARTAVTLHPALLPRLVLQPVLFGVVVALRSMGRTCVRRRRQRDIWDLRCRWAFIRGFCGSNRAA